MVANMDTKSIWELLFSLPLGTILSWIVVLAAIVSGISAGTVKLYKVFLKYKNLQDKDKWQTDHLNRHDEILTQLSENMEQIRIALEEQRNLNLKQLRNTIVNICESAIEKGEISPSKYRSLEELDDEYENTFHSNSYAKSLVIQVREMYRKQNMPVAEKVRDRAE